MPRAVAGAALAVGWRLHLAPSTSDLALSLPVMDTRATSELGWHSDIDALTAVGEMLSGMRQAAGGRTPPLQPDAGGRLLRHQELRTGVGERGGVAGDR